MPLTRGALVFRHVLPALFAAAALLQPGVEVSAQQLVPVPALTARVIDQTGTLSPAEQAELEERLAGLEQRKGSQIAVLIVGSVRPEAIEQYAIRVADAWQLGRDGVDDGLLLLVAKDDREVRVEVGYGLEGAIPDARANRVIEEFLLPGLRAGDYAGGIRAGIDALIALVDGEPLPEPPATNVATGRGELLPFIFFLAVVSGAVFRRLFGQLPGALATGALASGVTWFLIGALGITLLMALVGFFVGLNAGRRGGRWVSRGPGGFGGGAAGRAGGGFRGGGGGFGGGGASGRW